MNKATGKRYVIIYLGAWTIVQFPKYGSLDAFRNPTLSTLTEPEKYRDLGIEMGENLALSVKIIHELMHLLPCYNIAFQTIYYFDSHLAYDEACVSIRPSSSVRSITSLATCIERF